MRWKTACTFWALFLTACPRVLAAESSASLEAYRTQLEQLRTEFGGRRTMPDAQFFLFGMGNRTKLVYRSGKLIQAMTGHTVQQWPAQSSTVCPPLYSVELRKTNGTTVQIVEDQNAVWLVDGAKRKPVPGTQTPLTLPSFSGFKYDLVLRELHHEILINILDGKPLPNFLVYNKPWRRDAAMMAMCLQRTGNAGLIRDWVLSLRDPYDHNNAANGVSENEADNLGQTLFLLSLFSDKKHPAVSNVLAEVPRFLVQGSQGKFIRGRSDFHETPLYQTKWLKFGLRSLGLEDPYVLPDLKDDYSSLFWWDFKQAPAGDEPRSDDYPYLGWARDHFHGKKRNPISSGDYPLTWEINASQADYARMAVLDPKFVTARNSMPHSWHSAEVFLYLLDLK